MLSRQSLLLIVITLQVICYPSNCHAVVVLDQAHLLPTFSASIGRGLFDFNSSAQTFTVNQEGTLAQIDVALSVSDFATGDIQFDILPTIGGVPSGSGPLFSTTIPLESIGDYSHSNYFTTSVDVSGAGLYVQPGDELAWVVSRPGPQELSVFITGGGDDYPGGSSYDNWSSGWLPNNDYDLFFRTFVDTDATGGSLTLEPTVAARVDLEEGTFVLDTNPFSITAFQSVHSHIDRRGILEFPITSLPENSELVGATLTLDINGFTSSSDGTSAAVSIFGYAGDGVASLNDAAIPADLVAVTENITETGPISVELDLEFIESLVGEASHVGLLLIGDTNRHQASFDNFNDIANLQLDYEFITPGDFDRDQDIDGQDFLAWQRGESITHTSNADLTDWQSGYADSTLSALAQPAPEPTTATMLIGLLSAIAGIGWRKV